MSPQREFLAERKVAVMGYPCVGKSSLTIRFIDGTFPDAYDPTIDNAFDKVIEYKGFKWALRLLDTAGQQEYSLFPRSCTDIHGFVLVYAINSKQSFEIVQVIYDKIIDHFDTGIPIILVGNKLDLDIPEREVSTEEGRKLATKWGALFIESSAKEDKAVTDIFHKMLISIEKGQGNIKPEKNSCNVS